MKEFRKIITTESKVIFSLTEFIKDLPPEAWDKLLYKHPSEWVIKEGLYLLDEGGPWTLETAINTCKTNPKFSTTHEALYKKLYRWVKSNIHLSFGDFILFFVKKRPVRQPKTEVCLD